MMDVDGIVLALASLLLFYFSTVNGQGTLSTVPRNVPLLNKSPYFGIWVAAPEGPDTHPTPAGANVTTWDWRKLDWNGLIRVDGQVFQWLGNETAFTPATTTETYLTASRTMYTMEAGPVSLNVTFLSPVEPQDMVKISFPFGYVYVDVWSNDGSDHSIQLYSDAASSFVTIRNDTMEWATTETPTSVYHDLHKRLPSSLERFDMVENGNLCFAMPKSANPTWQTGAFNTVRQAFLDDGKLGNTQDTTFRPPLTVDAPVMAFAVDLGTVQSSSSPIVWALGHVRRDLMTTFGTSSLTSRETRTSYFWSQHSDMGVAIDAFLADFPTARSKAEEFDTKLRSDASTISVQYADLVALSVRQTLANIEVTLPERRSGQDWNTSDVSAFMRDTGVSKRSNPVEGIYAALPALLYLNPNLLQLLLKPLLTFQASAKYANTYAAPDLGDEYTSSTGNSSDTHRLGVESSSSMLILSLVHALKTKDYTTINRHSSMLRKWTDFLLTNALHPKDQMSVDGVKEDDLSNLALKGITGIYAMAKIQELVDPDGATSAEVKRYFDQATSLASQWESSAISQGHVASVYGQPATWALMYNYFTTSLIAPDLFTKTIWDDQAKFYGEQLDRAPASGWGIPYDSHDPETVKSHWTTFTAASVRDTTVRNRLIEMIHRRTFWRGTAAPFSTMWSASTGQTIPLGGRNSPAQGAMFALLISEGFGGTNPKSTEPGKSTPIAAIAGGAAGGAVLLILLALLFFLWKRKKWPFKPKHDTNNLPDLAFGAVVNHPPPSAPPVGLTTPDMPFTPYTDKPDMQVILSPGVPVHLLPTPFNATTTSLGDSSSSRTGAFAQDSKELSNSLYHRSLQQLTPSLPGSPSLPTQSVATGSVSAPSTQSATSTSELPKRQLALVEEVEELRREVQALRARDNATGRHPAYYGRSEAPSEPPPMYS